MELISNTKITIFFHSFLDFTRQDWIPRVESWYCTSQSYRKMFAARELRDSCTRGISWTQRSSRVQKNENYLSAEQCRLTVSNGRPNGDPHYSLTAGMRSVHTRLPIHAVFRAAPPGASREPRHCLNFRRSYGNICATLTFVGNNH